MNSAYKILITDLVPQNTLVTRECATKLIEKSADTVCGQVEMDFTGITYISRSFADQFYKEKLKLKESDKKEIVVINAHHDVLEMFKTVSRTQNRSDRANIEYPKLEFQSRRALKQYLHSI